MTYGFIFLASRLFFTKKFYLSGAYAARFSATRHGRQTLLLNAFSSRKKKRTSAIANLTFLIALLKILINFVVNF
jgi:TRAP-type mannitol/chloroaromatic compound transport system permease small subunit